MTDLTHLLYVDDDADMRAIATLALEQLGGFRVTVCADGPQALAALPEAQAQLALLDVVMPGMDGLQLLTALRATPAGANLPVIFMTGQADASDREDYRRLGALGTIAKPFDPMVLADQVRALWAERRPS